MLINKKIYYHKHPDFEETLALMCSRNSSASNIESFFSITDLISTFINLKKKLEFSNVNNVSAKAAVQLFNINLIIIT